MRSRPMTDFPRSEAGLVDNFIGTAFDAVYAVYKNLDEILTVDDNAAAAIAASVAAAQSEVAAAASAANASASAIQAAEAAASIVGAVAEAIAARDSAEAFAIQGLGYLEGSQAAAVQTHQDRIATEAAAADAAPVRADLALGSGSDLVGTQVTPTAQVRTVLDTLKDRDTYVTDYGAGIGGDDNIAFENAALVAIAKNNITGERGSGGIPRAGMVTIVVPPSPNGLPYNITRRLNNYKKVITWQMSQGAVVNGYNFLNGNCHRVGQRLTMQANGNVDYACGFSIRANNSELDAIAEVTGVPTPSGFGRYGDRDTVGLYVDNTSKPALIDEASGVYTATTVTIPAQALDTVMQLQVGMFVDTGHTPNRYTGILTDWNTDGSVLTVEGWYLVNGVANNPKVTPPNGAGPKVNAFTKIWAHNANVFLPANGAATNGATGFELGIANNKGDSPTGVGTSANRVWGFDAASLSNGLYRNQAGFITRGKWVYGHATWGDITYPYMATDENGILSWRVDSMGNMEIGKNGVASNLFLDFHSGAFANDYDTRFLFTGGADGVNGKGTLQIATDKVLTGDHEPDLNNTRNLGSLTKNWAAGWFGTVNASVGAVNSLEVGSMTIAATSYVDFHSSGTGSDYDGRISSTGGSSTAGSGGLNYSATNGHTFNSKVKPLVTLVTSLGDGANQWADVRSMLGTFTGPVKLGQYTLATLPSAATYTGYKIDVTDATGGPKECRSDGTNWRITNTTTIVS